MKTKVILSFLLLLGTMKLFAQPGWNWPEDGPLRAQAQEKNALYTDHLRTNNFKDAKTPLVWLLKNTPKLNESIYINGIKVYENLADAETDGTKQKVLIDSALLLYDLRIEHFNNEASVTDRKAYSAYKYYNQDPTKYADLLKIFEKSLALNKDKIMDVNLLAYMQIVCSQKAANKSITDEQVLDLYDKLTSIVEVKKGRAKDDAEKVKLDERKTHIDQLLESCVQIDCDFVEKNLVPKMTANPDDVELSKKVFKYMLMGKCTGSSSFLPAAKKYFEVEPSAGVAIAIAKLSIAANDYETAMQYFNKATSLLGTDEEKKADVYLGMAQIYAQRGAKSSAREMAIKAASTHANSRSDAYTLVGDMYFNSYDQCKEGKSRVEDRGVFLAAYEMYKRAGNSSKMAAAKAQFPSMEEIFTEAKELGQTITVSCWINDSVTIQKRD